MPAITAILHTHNDVLRIARAVESLRPCDEVLVVDHRSSDETCRIARAFGARVISVQAAAQAGQESTAQALEEARHDWVFCLLPSESVAESLEASLLEWKLESHPAQAGFGISIREESPAGWVRLPAETRLVHREHARWDGWKPFAIGTHRVLEGYLTRFRLP
jgi:glycosyltransferase involved in cell wall biosynthesis